MRDLRPILLVEDNPKDAELTMAALARCQLLNDVTHVRDGVEALEYLRCQGRYEGAMHGGPVVVLLDLCLLYTSPSPRD